MPVRGWRRLDSRQNVNLRCVEIICTVCNRAYLAVPGAFYITGCPYCVLQARPTRAAEQNLINRGINGGRSMSSPSAYEVVAGEQRFGK